MSTHGSPPIQRPAAVVVASSSVAQVRTRIACSLSSAARIVLWCVSGTLRIHPRCGWRGGAATSAASQARASRNVSLSVSMMSDAGIDSGIGASREMIAYRTRNRRMKGLLMLRAVAASIAFVLALAGAAGAAGPELKTDEQKTLYALGLVIARNLPRLYLTKADLQVVEAGLAGGDRQGEGPLRGEAHRRHGVRQLRQARRAADAQPGQHHQVLERGLAHDEGRRQESARVPLRPGVRRSGPAAHDQARRDARLRDRASGNREVTTEPWRASSTSSATRRRVRPSAGATSGTSSRAIPTGS